MMAVITTLSPAIAGVPTLGSEHFRQIQGDFSALAEVIDRAMKKLELSEAGTSNMQGLARAKEAAEHGARLAARYLGSDQA